MSCQSAVDLECRQLMKDDDSNIMTDCDLIMIVTKNKEKKSKSKKKSKK